MARWHSVVGLREETKNFLKEKSAQKFKTDKNIKDVFGGDDFWNLSGYKLSDGRIFFEDVQVEPWASGPNSFLALKDESGEWLASSLWSDEEVHDELYWDDDDWSVEV